MQPGSMRFAHTLRSIREFKGMSQSKVAEAAGFDHSYISRLESGARYPTEPAVRDIAFAVGATDQERGMLITAAGYSDEEAAAFFMDPVVYQLGIVLQRCEQSGPAGEAWSRATIMQLEQTVNVCTMIANEEEERNARK
jgi:transcriptional regulator with XRE-family HTH domain